jgi:glycosyltransferase involved in cell wall biosynthesis
MSVERTAATDQIVETPGKERPETEISIVIPCLNEVETVSNCVARAISWLESRFICGEVIVADNGSTDGSVESSENAGARVVHVIGKGYGLALMGGIESARGRYVIMGDADESYDFSRLDGFLEKLRSGYDLVQGCRLPSGGGQVLPDAMPFLHRRLGNPLFSFLAQRWFGAPIHDVYCGLRGFSRSFYHQLNMQCTGMEFAVEMIIKASLMKARISEVPITLYRDGRVARKPHLRTFRDGWRTLRFFLLYSPRWLFLIPGIVLMVVGLAASLVLLPGTVFIGTIGFDFHTLVFAAALVVIGFNATAFAVLSRVFASRAGLLPEKGLVQQIDRFFNLETGLIIAGAMLALGIGLAIFSFWQWSLTNFGPLHSFLYVRLVVCSATLLILGSQLGFGMFFLGMLNLQRRSSK